MTTLKKKRNEKILAEIKIYEDLGYMTKDAIKLTAEKYYLSEITVRDIVYKKPKGD